MFCQSNKRYIQKGQSMKFTYAFAIATVTALFSFSVSAQHKHGDMDQADQPYAGLESRSIKSLSDSDIADIQQGKGWGLALPAELNGWPGPVHLLELSEQLGLTPEQLSQIEKIYSNMKLSAVKAGEVFIAAEEALSRAFESGDLRGNQLSDLVDSAAAARAELRKVHLSAHLATPAVLTQEQMAIYSQLRGYTSDPCAQVPEGHDPDMWRKHNGCD
jgi:Spy/CpxP family protein refolding chaperone